MRDYSRILAAVAATPWAIHPEKGRVIADFLTRKAEGQDAADVWLPPIEAAAKKDKRRKPAGTVGVIPVHGTITQRADLFSDWSGGTSTEAVGLVLDEFVADPSVDAVILDVDSPGGTVYGVEELALKIHAATKTKKVIAVANSLAASAAYWIASQASEIVITPGGEVGSIGVYLMHRDRSAAMERYGEKVTFVSAGELKTAGHSYAPLDDVSRAVLQKSVDDYYDKFVRAVARGRNASLSAVRSGFGRGDTVRAEEAVKEGMADRIGTLDAVLSRYGLSVADLTPAADADLKHDIEVRKRKMRMIGSAT
jgi:signal peptide peptidase SppA